MARQQPGRQRAITHVQPPLGRSIRNVSKGLTWFIFSVFSIIQKEMEAEPFGFGHLPCRELGRPKSSSISISLALSWQFESLHLLFSVQIHFSPIQVFRALPQKMFETMCNGPLLLSRGLCLQSEEHLKGRAGFALVRQHHRNPNVLTAISALKSLNSLFSTSCNP